MTDPDLTRDAFLDGRVQAWQPRAGYRAATDPVLLAAAVPARAGQSVLELGCGVGVASLCLAARVPGLEMTGVEVQAEYAALARRNAAENGAALQVVEADLEALPTDLRARRSAVSIQTASGVSSRNALSRPAFCAAGPWGA